MRPLQSVGTSTEKLAELRRTITDYFNDGELRNICFDLGAVYEDLPGQSKADKVREFLVFLEHRGRIHKLVQLCAQQRPNVPWTEIVGGSETELDVQRMVKVLQQALPLDDPTPQNLLETLRRFQYFHVCLSEWKELHNLLNDIIYATDQLSREVERTDVSDQHSDKKSLARLWRPVAQKTDLLLDWAATIKYIAPPFVKLPSGETQGPGWAVELHAARTRIDELFQPNSFDTSALYDATCTFIDVAGRHMYLADRRLHSTVSELCNLSSIVLGSIIHEQT
jgi:hypothetical protein